jgi:hypothetical protein
MGGETRALFNRYDANRKFAMKYFEDKAEDSVWFMAETNNRMIGCVFLWGMNKKIPWLGIAVAEDWKGKHWTGLI